MAKLLIGLGLALVVVGLAWPWLSRLPLGRLPGDIVIEREHSRVYVPWVSCLVVSAVLSAVLWLFRR
ncbi:MAG: DUF2905 domain-containing protein [Gammaproteobacteria bacterium]